MSQSTQFYGLLALALTVSVLLYFGLRRTAPAAARISLAIGGAIAGGFPAVALLFLLLQPFRDGWNLFGLFVWGTLILPVVGGLTGLLAVFWWTEPSPARRRGLAFAMLSTLVVAPIAIFVLPRMLMLAIGEERPDSIRVRSIAIYEFTASPQSVAFPVPTRDGVTALVVVDRATRRARLIGESGFNYYAPHLSWDGERLLFVKRKKEGNQHELISCFVKTWRCRLAVRTDNNVVSPVEIEKDVVLYSSSPLITVRDLQRYSRHDFYLMRTGSDPIQLSSFGAVSLHSINVYGEKVLFGAYGPVLDQSVFPKPASVLADPRSEIFELSFDRDALRIPNPAETLKPKYLIGGYSVGPSVSQDGRSVAFLNTELGKGAYRFNLVVADTVAGSRKRIDLEGEKFSRAAFAGEQMLFNELMSNRYRVRAWTPASDTIGDVFEIEFGKLADLERIGLLFAAE